MSTSYSVNIGTRSRVDITNGDVGHFVFKAQTGGSFWIGDSAVDDSNGISLANNETHVVYVTSPDTVYLFNESNTTAGVVRVFHNR